MTWLLRIHLAVFFCFSLAVAAYYIVILLETDHLHTHHVAGAVLAVCAPLTIAAICVTVEKARILRPVRLWTVIRQPDNNDPRQTSAFRWAKVTFILLALALTAVIVGAASIAWQ